MKQSPDATSSSDSDTDISPSSRPQTYGLRPSRGLIPRTLISPPTSLFAGELDMVKLSLTGRSSTSDKKHLSKLINSFDTGPSLQAKDDNRPNVTLKFPPPFGKCDLFHTWRAFFVRVAHPDAQGIFSY
ncbi:hypothetical protein AVEN_6719-1 [Araneus ventricosus]|uniref:Uncharacterized protein n=1 Tax=Araneus ventricosus TaxID=182803 RepID=A0A4Y2QG45_ARAVE|nr:hypothetical protein AVEN_6719-1 [Araneus ventricosus]